ncbi:MAG TPA: TetR/AcrR family transcriptional regulator [Pseudonocardiaceae bacterium]
MEQLSSRRPREVALTDALLRIVGEQGLDQVSVREVASAAGVSIGTVQHYFHTKDAMLAAAFSEVVRRVRTRITSVELGTDVRRNLSAVLRELLPLDGKRAEEARIMVAFAARAATSPTLADIQRAVLTKINEELTNAFMLAATGRATTEQCALAAHVAMAAADGLALHAVSSSGGMSARQLIAALELLLDALVPYRTGTD